MELVGWYVTVACRYERHRVFVSVRSITSKDKPELQRKVIACKKLGLYIPAVEVMSIEPMYRKESGTQLVLW